MKVIVIGGGPAGIMAAISSARLGNEVILLEKNSSLGKKILITGKGRCNITSSINIEDFIKNIPGNGKFLYSSFQNFTNADIINLIENNGIAVINNACPNGTLLMTSTINITGKIIEEIFNVVDA